jgi:tRNA 2-thiocytidine biosynthesis protein TtcA
MDRSQFNFVDLAVTGSPMPDGDIAFDDEPCASNINEPSVIKLHSHSDK